MLLGCASGALAGDWPMWRYDAGRTAASPDDLPANLKLSWTRQYSQREPVWDDPLNQDLMPYDKVFEPILVGRRLILGFNDRDKVVALDIDSGAELWTFFCDGPVRFPPAAWQDKVYVASDDGYLYCLDAGKGTVVWKFRGAPAARKAIGNKRVISCWPCRGGPVVRDGKVYFTASIWPFMGTFIYALSAETGHVEWVNDSTSEKYQMQPHGGALSFADVAPQGTLVATAGLLIVPGGRTLPAAFDRATGAERYFHFGGKGQGGAFVCADERNCYVHTRGRGVVACDLATGNPGGAARSGKSGRNKHVDASPMNEPVLCDGGTIYYDGRSVVAGAGKFHFQEPVDGSGDLIRAGGRIYAAGRKAITALDATGKTVWSQPVEGEVLRLLAGAGKLVAVTLDGRILVYGEQAGSTTLKEKFDAEPGPDETVEAKKLIARSGAGQGGYALWFGAGDISLVKAVLAVSQLHVVVVDPDAAKVDAWRRYFDAAGLYGKRIDVHQGDPLSFEAPPYIARLVVVDGSLEARCAEPKVLSAIYDSVRPYGGALMLPSSPPGPDFATRVSQAKLANARVTSFPDGLLVIREGALPGAADWTHQYGDIANTVESNDYRVKLPLGLLWFGGNSNLDVLPRHGHGPPEQVVGGRTIIEGMDCLSARDVYTGQVLWKRSLPDLGNLGVYFDQTYKDTPLSTAYNQKHIPGANARGTNFVATEREVYVVLGSRCEVLDAATGQTLRTIAMPKQPGEAAAPLWGFIGLYDDVLLGGAGFANYTGGKRDLASRQGLSLTDMSASDGLVAFDANTGRVLWRAKARFSFLHDGIVAGGGRVYCLDRLPGSVEGRLQRRGQSDPAQYRLVAFDAHTGRPVWQQTANLFGTWLSYSVAHDLLLQAGAKNRDRLADEVDRGMVAYRGRDGSVVWQDLARRYTGPCILHHDTILTNISSGKTSDGAFSLLTGQPSLVKNPLTGEEEPWRIGRTHGCNMVVASENLLTFRSGAAGFYDLARQGGTGNFGGFKSSCTSNLVVADGVLNAPDYTRTCTCSYQNQTSLALVNMPEIEVWTDTLYQIHGRVRQVGIAFGAPGDRRDDNGTLWIEYPPVHGVASPGLGIDLKGNNVQFYRHHALTVSGKALPWVAASGVRNVETISIQLNYGGGHAAAANANATANATANANAVANAVANANATANVTAKQSAKPTYTVRLYFAEPDELGPGARVFDVSLDGRKVLENFDVAAAAGGAHRSILREFKGLTIGDSLTLALQPKAGAVRGTILSGVELAADP